MARNACRETAVSIGRASSCKHPAPGVRQAAISGLLKKRQLSALPRTAGLAPTAQTNARDNASGVCVS